LIDVSQKELAGLLKYRETQKSEFRNSISCFLFIFSWALPVAKNEGCFLIQRNTGKERERERQMVLKKRKNKTERQKGKKCEGKKQSTHPFL
jgi:hypothetical protein